MEIDDILEEDLLEIFSGLSVGKANKSQNTNTKTKDTLSYDNGVNIDNFEEVHNEQPIKKQTSKALEINSENVDQFAILLKELLNNKTIEISIKIKES